MARVSECLVERYETQDVPIGKVREQSSGRVVLECKCRSRLILVGHAAVRCSKQDYLECGVCGERFVLSRIVTRRDHGPPEHREARSPTSTLDLRQHIKRFLTMVSISLALVVGTSTLAFARDSGKESSSGDQGKQATLSSLYQKGGSDDRPGDGKYDSEELEFLEIINKYRQDKGVPALILSDALTLASERHSEDMGRYNFFAHNTAKSSYFPTGSRPWDRIISSGYDYPNSSRAENLAAGYDTARKAFASWRASPGHNRNMLDRNLRVIGIARVPVPGSRYGWYWTTDFGSEKDPTSHAPGEAPLPERQRAAGKGQEPRK